MKRTFLAVAVAGVTILGLVGGTTAAASADAGARKKVGYTRVAVAPAVAELLTKAAITPATVGGAKAEAFNGTLAVKFKITGSSQKAKVFKHKGGVSLTQGAKQIVLTKFLVNTKKGIVTAKATGSAIGNVGRVPVFTIVASDRTDLGKVGLALNATSAGALNATFGVSAFKAGDTFGYASVKPRAPF